MRCVHGYTVQKRVEMKQVEDVTGIAGIRTIKTVQPLFPKLSGQLEVRVILPDRDPIDLMPLITLGAMEVVESKAPQD